MKDKLIELLRTKIDSYKANHEVREARSIRRVATPNLDAIIQNHRPGETLEEAIARITEEKQNNQ